METKQAVELKDWKGDNLHIDSDIGQIDGHNKPWNYIVTERESGKTTLMLKKAYNAFKKENRPSIIFRRYQTDVTKMYVEDMFKTINDFTDSKLDYTIKKGDSSLGGLLDVSIKGIDNTFLRIIALNTPLSRIKYGRLDRTKYMFFDEFICNRRIGEKYLNDEPLRVKEAYNTYNRYTTKYGLPPIKCYFFGNPYSLYNPFFSDKNVPTNKLYPGAFIAGDDYVVSCYQIKKELKEKLLKENPLYQFDEAYKKYAFDGRAVQDAEIRIETEQPNAFRLAFVFKIHGKCLGIYHGYRIKDEDRLYYWIKLIDGDKVSKRKEIVCFDFGDMASRTVLLNNKGKQLYSYLKESIEKRRVAYASIEESWLMEEIYQEI